MEYAVAKYRGNENGSRTRIATNDLISFGIFGENGKVLYEGKHWIRSHTGVVEILVNEKPRQAAIDPHFYLVDANTDDNVREVGAR